MAMQDDVVAFGKYAFDLDTLTGLFSRHLLEVFDKRLLAVHHMRVVLNVFITRTQRNRFGWPAVVNIIS